MSTTSLASTQKPSSTAQITTLRDLVSALEKKGRPEEGASYYFYITAYLGLVHEIPEDKAIEMSLDDIMKLLSLPPKPLKYEGWNFFWGNAAFGRNNG